MKLAAIPILFGAMTSGFRASVALRRWADRGDPNHGWCSTLSRDHARDQRRDSDPPPPSKPE